MKTEGFASTVAWTRFHFPGIAMEDAHKGLNIKPDDLDWEGSDRKDPLNCVIARAAMRQEHCKMAIVCRSTAMLIYPEHKLAVRYQLNNRERKLIRKFDLTGKVEDMKKRFWLAPVWPTNRFDRAAARSRGPRPHNSQREQGPVKIVPGVRNWIRAA